MTMNLEEIRAVESRLVLETYERYPILFAGGEGVHIIDEKGERYLDLLSGIGVSALGYNHPAIVETIAKQSKALLHISNLFYHEGQAELALRLTERTGLDRVFFCNSGTEAWEGALKLARAYAGLRRSQGAPGTKTPGTKFLALEQGFHGRTFGSMATTYKAKYRDPFAPVVPGAEFVRFNDVADLRAKFSDEVCAILVEAIQGEGGVRPLSQEFLNEARALADSTGALLIVDEIQAGMGRTGKWCAYQHYGIQPDVTTLAKPIAGGLPLGAVLCTEAVAQAIHPGMHGSTFGGGPLDACSSSSAASSTPSLLWSSAMNCAFAFCKASASVPPILPCANCRLAASANSTADTTPSPLVSIVPIKAGRPSLGRCVSVALRMLAARSSLPLPCGPPGPCSPPPPRRVV